MYKSAAGIANQMKMIETLSAVAEITVSVRSVFIYYFSYAADFQKGFQMSVYRRFADWAAAFTQKLNNAFGGEIFVFMLF